MQKENKKVYPIYAVAALWLIWSVSYSLSTVTDYIVITITSVILYGVLSLTGNKKQKPQTANTQVDPPPEKPQKEKTETEKLLDQLNAAISDMRKLNDSIKDETISNQISDMESTTQKILEYVAQQPDKIAQIRKFMNYYLPTTIKLLTTYDIMSKQGIEGENITSTKAKIEKNIELAVDSFHKHLDRLFGSEALDVSTDITVMENMLKADGLSQELSKIEIPNKDAIELTLEN